MLRVREVEKGVKGVVTVEKLDGTSADHSSNNVSGAYELYCPDCQWVHSYTYSNLQVVMSTALEDNALHAVGCGREEARGMY